MTPKNLKFFGYAKNVAEMSDYKRIHIGCVAVQGNKILSTGFNSSKSHPLQAYYNRFRGFEDTGECKHGLHAEIACLLPLRDTDIDMSKVDVYIYRIRKDILHGICRPCPACMKAFNNLGIKNIYYTTDNGYAYEFIN